MVKRGATSAPGDTTGKKTRRTMTVDSIVQQKIRDNFKEFGPENTDCKRGPDGRTLRERLILDYKSATDSKISFGRTYYEVLRAIYHSPDAAHTALAPADPSLPVSPMLVKAVVAAQKTKPDRSIFQSYMATLTEVPNATEVSGIFRFFLTLRPLCMKQLAVSMDCLRFVQRLKLCDLHALQAQHIKPWIDQVLVTSLVKSRTRKTPDTIFIDLNLPFIEMIIPKAPLNKVLTCKGPLLAVHTDLLKVVSDTTLGKDLFEASMAQVCAEQVAKAIDTEVAKCFGLAGTLTPARLETAQSDAMVAALALPGVDFLPAKRTIKVLYRCYPITLQVASIAEESNLRFACMLRGLAAQQGSLPKLWCEDLVVDADKKLGGKSVVPKAMVKESKAARDMVKQMVQDAACNTADSIGKVLSQKAASLLLVDPVFKVELGIVGELTTDGGESKLMLHILKLLPAADRIVSADTVAQKLHTLAGTDLFRLSSRASQEKFKLVQHLVACIVEARRPEVQSAMQDDYLSKVVTTFQFFVSVKLSPDRSVFGADALKLKVKELSAKEQANTATLDDLKDLRIFHWLLSEDDQVLINRIAKVVAANASATLAVVKGSRKGPKQREEAIQKTDNALQNALDMFK